MNADAEERAEAELNRRGQVSPLVWVARVVTVVMLLVGVVVGIRKFRTTPEQEELRRYVQLTVPGYLEQVAAVRERFTQLAASPVEPARARAQLVDEITPMLVRLRKHAISVRAVSPSARARNAEFVAAVDAYIEMARTSVRQIDGLDDPSTSGEEAHRRVRQRQRVADEAVRDWMARLRESCARAGFTITL